MHDTSRRWRSSAERRRAAASGARGAASEFGLGEGGPVPFVAGPDGKLRGLDEEESYLQRRRTPKPRKRWFAHNRRLGTG